MATYFVSNAGSDALDGLSTGNAWQTISKVNGFTFAASDIVLFRRGDRWKETLTVPRNTMTFGAYGAAAVLDADGYCTNAPVIDGGEYVTSWSSYSGGISDSYLVDDFAGTSGAALSTSTPEIGTGAWAKVSGNAASGCVISSDGMARRNTTGAVWSSPGTEPTSPNYVVETVVKLKTLDINPDLICNIGHMNPSDQGYGYAVVSGLVCVGTTNGLVRTGHYNGTQFFTDVPITLAAGATYTIRSVFNADSTTVQTYVDDVLYSTWDWSSSASLVGDFRFTAGDIGFALGGSTSPLGTDTQGFQVDSFDCRPINAPGTPTNTYQATVATDPKVLDRGDELILHLGAGPNLLQDGEWIWQNGVLYLREDLGQPNDTTIIGGVRNNAVNNGARVGTVLDGLGFEHARLGTVTTTNGSGLTLRDCMFQISTALIYDIGSGASAVHADAHTGLTMDGCHIRECGDGCTLWNGCTSPTFTNNVIGPVHGTSGDCIQIVGTGGSGVVTGNRFHGSTVSPKGLLLLVGDNWTVTDNYFEGTRNYHVACFGNTVTVSRNIFYRCLAAVPTTGGGFEITDNTPTAAGAYTVDHNIFVDCNPAINIWGSNNNSANRTNIKFYNNDIINIGVAPTDGQVSFQSPVYGEFKNNIIWDFTNTAQSYKLASIVGAQTWVSDYNIIGPQLTNFINFTGTQYSTLAAYVAGKSQDSHSVATDPLLWNPGGVEVVDYELRANSPAYQAGLQIAGINTTLTIGAREPRALGYADKILLTTNLRAYYRLEDPSGTIANDRSLNALNGTYTNSPALGQTSLININDPADKAVDFARASSHWVAVPDNALLDGAAQWSVIAWVRPDTAPTSGQFFTIASKGTNSAVGAWSMDYRDAVGVKQLTFGVVTGAFSELVVAQTLTVGQTYMLVGTYDGANMRLYVNGSMIGAPLAKTGTVANSANGVAIGGFGNPSPVDFFDGVIDEVALFSRGLSGGEILALWNAGISEVVDSTTKPGGAMFDPCLLTKAWH
jgi:hypothetical protein